MLWLDRPPIWRWLAAALLVSVAAWSELAPPPTQAHAFAAVAIPAGTRLTEDLFVSHELASGALETVSPHGVAAADIAQGDPLVASLVTDVAVPHGWLVIEAPLPAHAVPGSHATAVVIPATPGAGTETFPALVAGSGSDDPFGEASGQLAVPADRMAIAAQAVTEGRLVVGVAALPDS